MFLSFIRILSSDWTLSILSANAPVSTLEKGSIRSTGRQTHFLARSKRSDLTHRLEIGLMLKSVPKSLFAFEIRAVEFVQDFQGRCTYAFMAQMRPEASKGEVRGIRATKKFTHPCNYFILTITG